MLAQMVAVVAVALAGVNWTYRSYLHCASAPIGSAEQARLLASQMQTVSVVKDLLIDYGCYW